MVEDSEVGTEVVVLVVAVEAGAVEAGAVGAGVEVEVEDGVAAEEKVAVGVAVLLEEVETIRSVS